ncbi:MAG: bifunctional transcriptional activator/DNA repair enzyme AdaA [Pseudomonadota bacterium]
MLKRLEDVPDESDKWWRAVETRDVSAAGRFVVAVKTTGIYCRPGCPARTPKRANAQFFTTPLAARGAGFRACKRCDPDGAEGGLLADLLLLEQACGAIEAGLEEGAPPRQAALAARLGVRQSALRAVFARYLGITPKAYGEARRLARLRGALRGGAQVTQAIYEAGFDGPRRVYELCAKALGMTPGRFAKAGAGEVIRYGVVTSPLGALLVAATDKGVCRIMLGDDANALAARLAKEFHRARLVAGDFALACQIAAVLAHLGEGAPLDGLALDIQATAFEARVWRALIAIPRGTTMSYGDIARALGKPKASRAVGRACGANPVAILIPCHRVVGADGALTGYAWGVNRKKALLAKEGALD